jgi:hypothetical protein
MGEVLGLEPAHFNDNVCFNHDDLLNELQSQPIQMT